MSVIPGDVLDSEVTSSLSAVNFPRPVGSNLLAFSTCVVVVVVEVVDVVFRVLVDVVVVDVVVVDVLFVEVVVEEVLVVDVVVVEVVVGLAMGCGTSFTTVNRIS